MIKLLIIPVFFSFIFSACGLSDVNNAKLSKTPDGKGIQLKGEAECSSKTESDEETNSSGDKVRYNDKESVDCRGYIRCNFYNSDMSILECSKTVPCDEYNSDKKRCIFTCTCNKNISNPRWAATVD